MLSTEPGEFQTFITAHCIDWSVADGMELDEHHLERVEVRTGGSFRLSLWACDPISDIAVLGGPTSDDDMVAFEEWHGRTPAVPLSRGFDSWSAEVAVGDKQYFDVHVLGAAREWTTGKAMRTFYVATYAHRMYVTFDSPIVSGTSGGPVVDRAGRLVGVVSNSGGVSTPGHDILRAGGFQGTVPVAAWALPRWILARIRRAMKSGH